MSPKQAASLYDAFERALDVIQARVSVSAAVTPLRSFAVAYSGGLDSSALLHLAHRYASSRGLGLHAFHIHHGISGNADDWLAHCERACAELGVRFDARQIVLNNRERDGVEQAARLSRYAALGELCRQHQVPLLLTAHHLDDQAETVLLQLLRGCGVAGLAGMDSVGDASALLGEPGLTMGRPLLNVARAELERFVAGSGIAYVEDESNADSRYARNALRHSVMPSLSRHFPGFQERFARAAQHAQSAQRLLDELAVHDLEDCRAEQCIDIDKLKGLSLDRIDNLLRYWIGSHGMRMPSTAWMAEMRVQLFGAAEDAQLCMSHPEFEIRRHRNKIFFRFRAGDDLLRREPLMFRWRGEARIDFPAYGGSLHFESAGQGIDAAWLRGQSLLLRYRSGGEKLKAALNRPTRSLKHHYQALDIPVWERLRLPLVCTAAGQLLFAAGIGLNWRDLPICNNDGVQLRWQPAQA